MLASGGSVVQRSSGWPRPGEPCWSLPIEQQARAALAARPDVTDRLEAAGAHGVGVGSECGRLWGTRGEVQVRVDTLDQARAVDAALDQDGYGVPMRIVNT